MIGCVMGCGASLLNGWLAIPNQKHGKVGIKMHPVLGGLAFFKFVFGEQIGKLNPAGWPAGCVGWAGYLAGWPGGLAG